MNHSAPPQSRLVARCDYIVDHGKYTASRSLNGYKAELGAEFSSRLERLGPEDIWLDAGAGEACAQRDYLETAPNPCKVVACDRHMPRSGRHKPEQRLRFLKKDVTSLTQADIGGRLALITDLYGALSYAPNLSQVLATYLVLLRPAGAICAKIARIRLWITTGHSLREYLQAIDGARLVQLQRCCGQFGGDDLVLERTAAPIQVPSLELLHVGRGLPPTREYGWPTPPRSNLLVSTAHVFRQIGHAADNALGINTPLYSPMLKAPRR